MDDKIKYEFSAKLWKHNTDTAWHFVTVPMKLSQEIRANLQWQEEGWGRMKAIACIKDLNWNTSIWFDTKVQNYVLPVKAEIRKKLCIKDGDVLDLSIFV